MKVSKTMELIDDERLESLWGLCKTNKVNKKSLVSLCSKVLLNLFLLEEN